MEIRNLHSGTKGMAENILKIGITGLGLIGGSILKALHKINTQKQFEITGISKSSYMKAAEFCTYSSPNLEDLANCNIVFVCSKMSETPGVLEKLENILHKDTIVTDVSSLKRFVNNKNHTYNFIGGHPMAGTEFSGFENSFAELFNDAKWILNTHNEILEDLIKKMGATPIIMEENIHDTRACLISHLPMLVSCALLNTVVKEDTEALKIASSGFRDTTRLSLTDISLALDMLEFNKDNFDILVDKFIENLKKLKNMPKVEFRNTLETIQKIRKDMYDNNGKNKLPIDNG